MLCRYHLLFVLLTSFVFVGCGDNLQKRSVKRVVKGTPQVPSPQSDDLNQNTIDPSVQDDFIEPSEDKVSNEPVAADEDIEEEEEVELPQSKLGWDGESYIGDKTFRFMALD